jgi:hypothetical protein
VQVIVHHDAFLDSCMKESMLFWPKILRRLEKIKLLCLQFVATSQSLTPAVGIDPGCVPWSLQCALKREPPARDNLFPKLIVVAYSLFDRFFSSSVYDTVATPRD